MRPGRDEAVAGRRVGQPEVPGGIVRRHQPGAGGGVGHDLLGRHGAARSRAGASSRAPSGRPPPLHRTAPGTQRPALGISSLMPGRGARVRRPHQRARRHARDDDGDQPEQPAHERHPRAARLPRRPDREQHQRERQHRGAAEDHERRDRVVRVTLLGGYSSRSDRRRPCSTLAGAGRHGERGAPSRIDADGAAGAHAGVLPRRDRLVAAGITTGSGSRPCGGRPGGASRARRAARPSASAAAAVRSPRAAAAARVDLRRRRARPGRRAAPATSSARGRRAGSRSIIRAISAPPASGSGVASSCTRR